MAKTFYKYVQRDQEARVNWADVAKNFSDSLKEEAEDRLRRKEELRLAQDEYLKYVQEPPQGDNQTLNSNIQGFANSAMEQATVMYDLLTSGQLNPRDYKMNMQNLADDTQGLYDVWTQYSEDYTSMLERQNVPEGQLYSEGAEIEGFMWQNMEFFSNFENFKPTIDPTSGRVYYAKVDKDGNISTNPNDRASIMDLRSRLRTKYDNVDVDGLTTKVTDQIGKWVWENRQGRKGIEVLDDMRGAEGTERRKQYEDYKTNSINALMVNKIDNATILTNHVGTVDINGDQESYTFTWDPEEAKTSEKFILLTKDKQSGQPQPQLTDKQEQTVRDYLGTRIDIKIDQVRKFREHYDGLNYAGYNAKKNYERQQEPDVMVMDQLVNLGQGTLEQQRAAIEYLRKKSGVVDLKVVTTSGTGGTERITKISYKDINGNTVTRDVSGFNTENFVDANILDFVSPEANINHLKRQSASYNHYQNKDLSGESISNVVVANVGSELHKELRKKITKINAYVNMPKKTQLSKLKRADLLKEKAALQKSRFNNEKEEAMRKKGIEDIDKILAEMDKGGSSSKFNKKTNQ